MKTHILKYGTLIFFFLFISNIFSQNKNQLSDREYWVKMIYQLSQPVLENMSKGELKKNMQLEFSPIWDNRDKNVAYMETFGRLMAGITPWLNLPDDNTAEGKLRKQVRAWAIASYTNAVDPDNPDYLKWEGESQVLVDAAYLANSFTRAPERIWKALDKTTQNRYIKEFKKLRKIRPAYNNWLLFRAMIEAFLASVDENYDGYILEIATRKINEWYLGDGWYADGPDFSLDYYNGYVIHPMYVEIIEILENHQIFCSVSFNLALKRMQRYNQLLERLISPEATYPPIGRSVTYRMAAFQTLALSSWKYGLPSSLTDGQVRNALTSVMKKMFSVEGNFNSEGFLQLGFVGHQPELADYYTNNGSLYMTSLVFLPLGLPASAPFWTSPPEEWTSLKAWRGEKFSKDYHESIRE